MNMWFHIVTPFLSSLYVMGFATIRNSSISSHSFSYISANLQHLIIMFLDYVVENDNFVNDPYSTVV